MLFLLFLSIIEIGGVVYDCEHKKSGFHHRSQSELSRVARLVDENGAAVILKNNVPRYVLVEFSQAEQEQLAEDEDILAVSKRLIAKNRHAYEELAK